MSELSRAELLETLRAWAGELVTVSAVDTRRVPYAAPLGTWAGALVECAPPPSALREDGDRFFGVERAGVDGVHPYSRPGFFVPVEAVGEVLENGGISLHWAPLTVTIWRQPASDAEIRKQFQDDRRRYEVHRAEQGLNAPVTGRPR